MKVIIEGTNQIEYLSIIDYTTNIDWIVDLLGNHGIHKDADTDAVTMSREEFDWWSEYTACHAATERDIENLEEKIWLEKALNREFKVLLWLERGGLREDVFDYMGQQDLENERDRAIQRLAELREEYVIKEEN